MAKKPTAKQIAGQKHDSQRSPEWPKVRAAYLAEHPTCAMCGIIHETLEIHHKYPFHLDPSRELDPANLITLCQHPSHNDHLIVGHLLDFKSYNPDVVTDAATWLAKIQNRPTGEL